MSRVPTKALPYNKMNESMEMTFLKAVNPQIQAANFSYSNPGNPISVLWVKKKKKKQWKILTVEQ